MARNDKEKEANDSEIISDSEIWSAIRYLDPELDRRESDIAAAIAVLAMVCIISLIVVFLGRV